MNTCQPTFVTSPKGIYSEETILFLFLFLTLCCSIFPDLCFAGKSETSLLWGTKTWQLYPASSAGLFTPLAVTLSFSH
jgi:hypothetical protein